MPSGVTFPAFIKLEYQRDGSAKSSFLAEVDSILGTAETRFKSFSAEAGRQLDAALSTQRNAGGSLDLNVSGLQAAAAAQKARAIAARELATATAIAAREQGDYSQKTRIAVAATEAQAIEEERAARAALSHAAAVEQVQRVLSRQASATNTVIDGTRRGTEANHLLVNSTRSLRLATLQAGQQVQDIGISLYSGQRASVVFAQQLPQLAFALSGLDGSANKTHATIGRFATFLSGPWGLAVGLAVGAAATYITSLIGIGSESEKAKNKTFDFSKALDVTRLSALDAATAMGQLETATRSAIAVQGDFSAAQGANARKAVGDLEGQLEAQRAALKGLEQIAASSPQGRIADAALGASGLGGTATVRAAIAETEKALAAARRSTVNAQIGDSQARVNDALDAGTAATRRYNIEVGKLNLRLEESVADPIGAQLSGRFLSGPDYDREFLRLTEIKKAAEEAARAKQKVAKALTLPEVTGGEVARLLGTSINPGGGTRTAAQNAAAKGAANSYHLAGQAIDIPLTINGKPLTKEGIRSELEAAGVVIKELLGPGDKDHSDHFHIAFARKRAGPDQIGKADDRREAALERVREAELRAQEQLEQFGKSSAEAIAQINAQFDDQPRLVDASAAAVRKLDKISLELNDTLADTVLTLEQRAVLEQNYRDAIAATAKAQSAVDTDIGRQIADQRIGLEIQTLAVTGREKEAAVLDALTRAQDRYGELTALQKGRIEANTAALFDQNEALQRVQEIQGAYLDATRSIRSEIEGLLSGDKPNFKRIFKQLQGKILFEQLFGDTFRKLEKSILRESGIEQSVDKLVKGNTTAGDSALALARDFADAGAILRGAGSGGSVFGGGSTGSRAGLGSIFDGVVAGIGRSSRGASNDNGGLQPNGDILVARKRDSLFDLTPASYFDQVGRKLTAPLLEKLDRTLGTRFFAGLSGVLGAAFSGYAVAGVPGAVLGAVQGAFAGSTSGIGKTLGSLPVPEIQAALALNKAVNGLLGNDQIKNGGTFGLFSPVLTALFGKALKGSANISGAGGAFSTTLTGNSKSRKKASGQGADSVIATIESLAEQLGGILDPAAGSVSIGVRKKNNVVDPTGRGRTKGSGVLSFGEDGEAAVRAATLDLLKDGVISGLRAGTQQLLQNAKTIEQGLAKAVNFQSVFDRLKARTDPVGAALDGLDREFSRLKSIFVEAGASTAEYADLEKLYGLERADTIKQAFESIGGSLKSLLTDLTINNDALSLRDRKGFAQARFDPLDARVKAGDVTAFDDFSEAARALLEIERQFSGSQDGYHRLREAITATSQAALDASTALADAASGRDSPFSKSGVPANDNQGVIDAIGTSNDLLNALNQNMGILIQQGQLNQSTALAGRGFF